MKNPALTGGVSLQFKLRLTRLLLALVPYIRANRDFADAHHRVSSTAIFAPGEQQTAPGSHPHPPRWGTPASLEPKQTSEGDGVYSGCFFFITEFPSSV